MTDDDRPSRRLPTFAIGALVALVAIVAFTLIVIAGSDPADDSGAPPATTTATTTPGTGSTPSTVPTTTSSPQTGAVDVRAYFVRNELVATAGRTVTAPAVARGALEALLDGPTAAEVDAGMSSAIPAGTELLGIAIDDGAAVVDLTGAFQSGGGSLSMQLRVAQVVFSLTQFDTVDTVTIELDGEAVDAIGGEGVDATDLTRADVAGVTPAILVEAPVPGEAVSGSTSVRGMANTFEATLLYELVDAEGTVLDDGFATATAGNGTWGTFAFEVDAGDGAAGSLTLRLWQESADSGERRDVYEVLLRGT